MQYRIFTINAEYASCEEMNTFLRGRKIVEVEKHFYAMQTAAFWTFCVSYIDEIPNNQTAIKKEKIDYKDVLDEKSFEKFIALREMRKDIAQKEGIPVYAVFTNEEMANIAKLDNLSLNALQSINGIGEKRVEKYGKAVIETLSKIKNQD